MRPRAWQLLAVFFLCALSASAADFRQVTWGMSVDDVNAAESDVDFSQEDSASSIVLSAHVAVMGQKGTLDYVFEGGKLIIGQYRFVDDDDMGTFKAILAVLKKKYGTAASSGAAFSRWNTPRTYVSILFKDNICRVDYADQAWFGAAGDQKKKQYDLQ